MRYKSFRIRNFKGIKNTSINLDTQNGASVFALVGLNESGKTTVLEAIHSFNPDKTTERILGGELGVPHEDRVPRHLLSEFSGDVSVSAELSISRNEFEQIAGEITSVHDIKINTENPPSSMEFDRYQEFKNGDLQESYFTCRHVFEVKSGKQRKWRSPEYEERRTIRDAFAEHIPSIAFFPTFIFNFPEHIYLSSNRGSANLFYKSVFQDILDFDGRGQTIEKDIIRRVQEEELIVPWLEFLPKWLQRDDQSKIQHIMDRAGQAVTKQVFGRWNEIFGEQTKGKEIIIAHEIVEGKKKDGNFKYVSTNQHDVRIKFQVRDGTRRYAVNDRSLGFRWFFSFMLFTQFRTAKIEHGDTPILFLFDEPASNLHAAAQQKLIESFPEIASNGNKLIYSTHSHYMIEPKWLEQTFIVKNRADLPPNSVLDEISLDDESLDIQIASYRSFVNDNPTQTNYFQPILDRLEVVPSRFDLTMSAAVVEGKSDYYILRYAKQLLGLEAPNLIPGVGSQVMDAMCSIHVGWNLNLMFLVDGDKEGKASLKRYREDYLISDNRLITLPSLVTDITEIEDVLDDEALGIISSDLMLTKKPSKNQIRRFFQERLASHGVIPLGNKFEESVRHLCLGLSTKLSELG